MFFFFTLSIKQYTACIMITVPHFIIALILKKTSAWKATDGMCTCNQLRKRSQHAATLRKACKYMYKICISLPHTHAHGSMYVHVAACLQLCLAHSNCMSERMYAVCPDVCLLPFLAYCIIPCPPIFERPSLNALSICGCVVSMCVCLGV